MNTKLIHPLWTHLPAIVVFVILIVYILIVSPLPAQAPVHFSLNGEPDKYGSPWSVFGLVIGLSVFFILLSAFIDELWARQEKAKVFNWLSLMDDIVVGAMVGFSLGYLDYLRQTSGSLDSPWGYLWLIGGSTAIVAVILEMIRPYHLYSGKLTTHESQSSQAELTRYLKENSTFTYWDYQNPFYVSMLTICLPIVLLLAAVFTWFSEPLASLLLLVVAVVLVIPYGGQRTMVNRQAITVRFGVLGIRVLRLKMRDITEVMVHEFSPLKDFGGYGIRFNREMKAYFLRGTKGVKLTNTDGKEYLIGSDFPERLVTVISTVSSTQSVEDIEK